MVIRAESAGRAIGTCVPLEAVSKEDLALAGGKGASLGEMLRSGIPVPPGFVVTTRAFKAFMEANRLSEVVEGILGGIDVHSSSDLSWAAAQIQKVVLSTPMPASLVEEIQRGYEQLGAGPVAVRSSATAEDLEDASFAGQQRTLLNVEGAWNVVKAVQACWASLFESRAIFYRQEHGFNHTDVAIAVPVQRMVASEVSGVMFTIDPSTGDREAMLIEAIYGLGEPLVSGELSPDGYLVDRKEPRVRRRELALQPWLLRRNPAGDGLEAGSERVPVPEELRGKQKLADRHIIELAALGLKLERHYGKPQDVEWAMADGTLYILQSRPITTVAGAPAAVEADGLGDLVALLSGSGASPGVAAGPVRLIRRADEIDKVLKGDVLVTEMTTPDFVPAMKRAAAIVTDRGGRTCHAAIVSREMGLPCVVGTGRATEALGDGAVVTVDGRSGKVYAGDMVAQLQPERTAATSEALSTRTKLYVNLADPDAAERIAAMGVDGVGLLRAEFIIAHLGEHPRAILESGRGAEFTAHLSEGLERFAAAFAPRPVVYRFSDFKTNEYRNLKGGEHYEPREENPMIGYRGCGRYLQEPDLFALEVEAVKAVRRRYLNLWAMVPFVRTVPQLREVVHLMEACGLERGDDFKLWMMVEVPSNVLLLDQFLDAGVDGVSIGSNDLTQLVLGVDRDNEQLAALFDERDPAVLCAIERVVRGCSERGVTVSICGQAPSCYPELTRQLVRWGITSVSVSPDMIDETRSILYKAERAAETNGHHEGIV